MTKATTLHPTQGETLQKTTTQPTQTPKLHYTVAMSDPASHLFEVTLHIHQWQPSILNLKMPVWTPGSYLVREYAKQVQDFKVKEKTPTPVCKVSKNHWQINTEDKTEITLSYRVFANELTVRTNHLDTTHGYFNGAALFCYIPDLEHFPITVTIIPPYPDWKIATSLPQTEQENTFIAEDFDTLVDSPFEIGIHENYPFEVLEKKHRWVVWKKGNFKPKQVIADTQKIIKTEAKIYGELPYQDYLFLLHLAQNGFGGLEHKNSCSLIYSRFGFRTPEKYNRFMQLVAHEFFHLWNVKRIRPKELEIFDYNQENFTTSLWFCEGTTSYYDTIIPHWAGVYNDKTFFEVLSKDISRYLKTPGRKVQPLSESSFDAWIKLYRRDANSDNSQISYYLKGEMVSLLLDLLIRKKHNNQRSLNTVMRQMWEQFGKEEKGYTAQALKETLESVAEMNLTEFFNRYIDGLDELPLEESLRNFGLQLKAIPEKNSTPYLGVRVVNSNNTTTLQFVESHSPAAKAGLDTGDELLAINGLRVSAEELSDRLQDFSIGETVEITVFHQDELCTYSVQLGEPQPGAYKLIPLKKMTPEQKDLLQGWLNAIHPG